MCLVQDVYDMGSVLMKCSINNCENKVEARGWCNKHYLRWQRHGDPNFTKHHGYRYHPLYKVWVDMRQRCYNKNNTQYKDWGGRGITVCEEWMSPKAFIDWALPLWKKGLELDRTDNDGNYCPENCRFVTHAENSRNQRLLQENNTSGYRGVGYENKKWRARITINNKQKYLGCFDSITLAALRYDAEAYLLNDGRPRNFL